VLEHTAQVHPPKYSKSVASNLKIIYLKLFITTTLLPFPTSTIFLVMSGTFSTPQSYIAAAAAHSSTTPAFYCKN
jgi:uncharacterized membrane protein